MKKMIVTRDVYYIILGILIAFTLQVSYDLLREMINGERGSPWEFAQMIIIMVVAYFFIFLDHFLIVTTSKENNK